MQTEWRWKKINTFHWIELPYSGLHLKYTWSRGLSGRVCSTYLRLAQAAFAFPVSHGTDPSLGNGRQGFRRELADHGDLILLCRKAADLGCYQDMG